MSRKEKNSEDLIIPFNQANGNQSDQIMTIHSGFQGQNENENGNENEENGSNILANHTQLTIYTLALFYSFIDVVSVCLKLKFCPFCSLGLFVSITDQINLACLNKSRQRE